MRMKSCAALIFGRWNSAGPAVRRAGAELSRPPGPDPHRILAGRRDRRAGAVHRPEALGDVGPAGRRGEPSRRRRQHRRRGRGAGPARRLHPALRRADARHQRHALADHGVPSGHQLRADHAGEHGAGGVHGGERHAVQIGQGRRRLRQGQPGQAELRIGRHRVERASCDRAVQRRRRHQDAARAVQPDVAGLYRHLLGPHRDLVHHRRRLAAAHPLRQGPRACDQRSRALQAAAGPADHDRARHQHEGRVELVRLLRAQGHAEGDHRQDQPRPADASSTLPDMRERETQLGYRFMGGPPERLAAYLKAEIAKWDELAKKGSFK